MTTRAPRWTFTSPSPSGRSARWRTASRRWRSRCTSPCPGRTRDSLWSSNTRPGARVLQVGIKETFSTNERLTRQLLRSKNVERFSYFPPTQHLKNRKILSYYVPGSSVFCPIYLTYFRGKFRNFRPKIDVFTIVHISSHCIQVNLLLFARNCDLPSRTSHSIVTVNFKYNF